MNGLLKLFGDKFYYKRRDQKTEKLGNWIHVLKSLKIIT